MYFDKYNWIQVQVAFFPFGWGVQNPTIRKANNTSVLPKWHKPSLNKRPFCHSWSEVKEPQAIFVQCPSNFSLIGKLLLIDLHFIKPSSNAPITTAVKTMKIHSVPLRFDGTLIPITGTFPMLITFNITLSPSKESRTGRSCPTTGQREVRVIGRVWRYRALPVLALVLNLCTTESGH